MYETPDMIEPHKLLAEHAARIDAGNLRTTLNKRLSPINVANLPEAHRLVESGRMIGKVVVESFERDGQNREKPLFGAFLHDDTNPGNVERRATTPQFRNKLLAGDEETV
ncbi:zinc-binding dehydrogenase [Paenibacillus sp. IB182493]|uniref:Zinc-binding dehydrogenase n=2 Tax=Paenibacillus arenilitoris TaxID=2772299 RepID=A0A927CLF7_9BACL|nr:zinc-binding dehydrogenase [Paenibacillus arenilitoris]